MNVESSGGCRNIWLTRKTTLTFKTFLKCKAIVIDGKRPLAAHFLNMHKLQLTSFYDFAKPLKGCFKCFTLIYTFRFLPASINHP